MSYWMRSTTTTRRWRRTSHASKLTEGRASAPRGGTGACRRPRLTTRAPHSLRRRMRTTTTPLGRTLTGRPPRIRPSPALATSPTASKRASHPRGTTASAPPSRRRPKRHLNRRPARGLTISRRRTALGTRRALAMPSRPRTALAQSSHHRHRRRRRRRRLTRTRHRRRLRRRRRRYQRTRLHLRRRRQRTRLHLRHRRQRTRRRLRHHQQTRAPSRRPLRRRRAERPRLAAGLMRGAAWRPQRCPPIHTSRLSRRAMTWSSAAGRPKRAGLPTSSRIAVTLRSPRARSS